MAVSDLKSPTMKAVNKTIRRFRDDRALLTSILELTQAIKTHRHLDPDDRIDLSLSQLLAFKQLKDIDNAVALLVAALARQQCIVIIGDFDTDGATSTAVAVSALRALGAKHVHYLVPNRFKYGYGLTPQIVEAALVFKPDLLITVDNGIASIDGVNAANAAGIQVLVTDHHLAGSELPDAAAIVNPNQPGDSFQSKNLAGVGVIFYVMLALRSHLRAINWFANQAIAEPNLATLLDFVALGTVADVVPLDHNNRILVYQGLQRIRAGKCHPGISALIALGKKTPAQLQATDLGFIVAPRLNAAGRLEDMSLGINCLLAESLSEAQALAAQLDTLNIERRTIEATMQLEAYHVLENIKLDSKQATLGICLYQAHWHQGVTGIIAARLKDRYAIPTIAFAKVDNGDLKGSGRSVAGLNIRDLLDRIATKNPALIDHFGGHAMAAGLSLKPEQYDAFSTAFHSELALCFSKEQIASTLWSDGELAAPLLQLATANAIASLGPYGSAFAEPLFDGVFQLIDQRIVGAKHLKCTLQALDDGTTLNGIAFNVDVNTWPNYHAHKVHIAYRLAINDFQNRQSLQLMIESIHLIR